MSPMVKISNKREHVKNIGQRYVSNRLNFLISLPSTVYYELNLCSYIGQWKQRTLLFCGRKAHSTDYRAVEATLIRRIAHTYIHLSWFQSGIAAL